MTNKATKKSSSTVFPVPVLSSVPQSVVIGPILFLSLLISCQTTPAKQSAFLQMNVTVKIR